MTPEQLSNIFGISFYVFVAVAVIGLGLAVFFFFFYRIPVVYALMTGKTQKKTIEKMQRSGQLRSKAELEAEREASVKTLTGSLTGDFITEAISKAQPTTDQQPSMSYAETSATTVLAGAEETAVLEPEMETSVLTGDAETSVLGQGYELGVTTPLNQTMQAEPQDTTEGFEAEAPAPKAASQYLFESTEHTIVIHTDEKI